ncbi:MAG: GNAT family N-acetyltransferase [Rhodospirillaceae bacterium]|nr:GNAT family N-acetyltransferase [Rhodospirillaceae bacterium]
MAASAETLRQIDLSPAHAEAGFGLSALIGWNQTVEDWRYILAHGAGVGVLDSEDTLIGTAMALPYGRFAWICLVLVAPGWRRQGIATRLMDAVVQRQEAAGRIPGLDATPDGREVYRRIGFRDVWRLARYQAERVEAAAPEAPPTLPSILHDALSVRPLEAADLARFAAPDRRLFGADRLELLFHLRRRQPGAAFGAWREGRPAGYVLARDGREAVQIGPLVAADDAAAQSLAAAAFDAVTGPVFIDVADVRSGFVRWLESCGFALQRPYIRMIRGRDSGFDDSSLLYAIAGPELG